MTQAIYNITNDAVILVLDGTIYTGTREYADKTGVVRAILDKRYQWAADVLNKAKAIVRRSLGAFELEGSTIFYKKAPIHNTVADRIVELSNNGLDFMPAVNFLENLLQNPDKNSVNELYEFLEHKNLPLTADGCFLAYKTVQQDYFSKTAGSEPVEVSTDGGQTWEVFIGKIPNKVGSIVRMQRYLVDDNRNNECSHGLHVGSLGYAGPQGWFHSAGDNVVIVKINPRDAVSVPRDHSAQKLRVSQYEVVKDFETAYTAPLVSNEGAEFAGSTDIEEVVCVEDKKGCGWSGTYTQLKGGYRCPECLSGDSVYAADDVEDYDDYDYDLDGDYDDYDYDEEDSY
jgi:hypothetical protein